MPLEDTYPLLSEKIATARAAGYPDEEIQKHIQGRIRTATKAGYSVDEINAYLGEIPKPSIMEPIKDTAKEVGRLATQAIPTIAGVVAGTAAAPFLGPAAPAGPYLGGSAGSAAGEALAQYFFDDKMSPKMIALQGLLGAIPGFKAASITSQAGRAALRAAEGATMAGGATQASSFLEKGEAASLGDTAKSMLIGALVGAPF